MSEAITIEVDAHPDFLRMGMGGSTGYMQINDAVLVVESIEAAASSTGSLVTGRWMDRPPTDPKPRHVRMQRLPTREERAR